MPALVVCGGDATSDAAESISADADPMLSKISRILGCPKDASVKFCCMLCVAFFALLFRLAAHLLEKYSDASESADAFGVNPTCERKTMVFFVSFLCFILFSFVVFCFLFSCIALFEAQEWKECVGCDLTGSNRKLTP